jgi:tRNA pseudouridine 55 synthase
VEVVNLKEYEGIPVNTVGDNVQETGAFLVVDKPYRWTSADVVRKVKVMLRQHYGLRDVKVGHSGTLDPLATGVLTICLGRKATRLAETLQDHPKTYLTGILLGATTPCFDLEKEIDQIYPWEHITADKVKTVLASMIGEQDQIPPIFSAKMIDGHRAYNIARRGEVVEMKPNRITIWDASIESIELPLVTVLLKCSKGTYVRSFGRDLGEILNSGAHLISLRRLSSGPFSVDESLTVDDLEQKFSEKFSVERNK